MFGSGAQGFLALPYTIIVYPFVLLVMPRLFDIPFFYWWQFLCIPIGVLCVIVVFRATRGER